MIVEGNITVRFDPNGVKIELEDVVANSKIASIDIDVPAFMRILSGLSYIPCKIDILNIDKIGKKHENKEFRFPIPKELASSSHKEKLTRMAQSLLLDEWIADDYFGSQDSFSFKDGQWFAKCIIRRYI